MNVCLYNSTKTTFQSHGIKVDPYIIKLLPDIGNTY